MNKTIIAVHGRANEGKSETIKNVCKIILDTFPIAKPSKENINYSDDINLIIDINGVRIGIESQGDPNSRMIWKKTVRKLAEEKCDIILCATRTSGETVKTVDKIANDFDYHTLWISSYFSPKLNKSILNLKAANNIIEIIKSIISSQL